jgi:hypothetical protein
MTDILARLTALTEKRSVFHRLQQLINSERR